MTYEVKYKKKGQWFWRTIKDVKGDAYPNFMQNGQIMFFKSDDSSEFVPIEGTQFKFAKERHLLFVKRMEDQAGTKLSLANE